MQQQVENWKQIIWREWRHCNDVEYASYLFELVADEPVGWGSKASVILLNTVTGAALCLLAGFVFTLNWSVLQSLLAAGAAIGAGKGYLDSRGLVWRTWLKRLESNTPTGSLGRLVVSVILLALVSGMFFGPLAWLTLVGLFWGIGGVITWLNSASEDMGTYGSQDRRFWFWWRTRPPLAAVEAALQRACQASPEAEDIWRKPLRILAHSRKQPTSTLVLVKNLLSSDWIERFAARHTLLTLGPAAVPPLKEVANGHSSPLRQTAVWLLENIEQYAPSEGVIPG